MKRYLIIMTVALLACIGSVQAHAACGDGIFQPHFPWDATNEYCDPSVITNTDPGADPRTIDYEIRKQCGQTMGLGIWAPMMRCTASCECEYCGDGIYQPANGEQCGNSRSFNVTPVLTEAGAPSCPASLECIQCECSSPYARNGTFEPGKEDCDYSVSSPNWREQCAQTVPASVGQPFIRCSPMGRCEWCGDGFIHQWAESCDPQFPVDTCQANENCSPQWCRCVPPCGDGVHADFEQCDPNAPESAKDQCVASNTLTGNEPLIACNTDCECTWCGDTVYQFPPEECSNSGDQANPNWSEQGATMPLVYCMTPGEHCEFCECLPECNNNGVVDLPTEACDGTDQGNCPNTTPAGDYIGCFNCQCTYSSMPVIGICGNGQLDGAEECDPAAGPGDPAYFLISCTNPPNPGDVPIACTNPGPVGGGCECMWRQGNLCGNNVIDPGEDCDPPGDLKCLGGTAQCLPNCTCPLEGQPGCGDGILNGTEECSRSTANTATPFPNLPDWTETGPSGAMVDCTDPARPVCINCYCEPETTGQPSCGNGILEGSEQCEVGIPCQDPGAICDVNCMCVPLTSDGCPQCCPECCCPPDCPDLEEETPVALKSCSIKINGASTPATWEIFKAQNEAIHEIFEGTAMAGNDLYGEAGYSIVTFSVTVDDAIDVSQPDSPKLAPWALVQLSGAPPVDFLKEEFQPAKKVFISSPTRIFPLDQADLSAMSLKASQVGLKAQLKTVVLPDLSAGLADLSSGLGAVQVDSVLTALGSENVQIQAATDTQWKLNNVISLELIPTLNSTKASGGSTQAVTVLGRAFLEPDRASWTGVDGAPVLEEGEKIEDLYIENRKMGKEAAQNVMNELEKRVSALKAAGQPVDCSVLLGLSWEENLNYQYAFIQDANSDAVAFLASPKGAGLGGGGCKCDMSAAMPHASQLALLIGLGMSGLGGIIAVRRRRKK